MRRVAWLGLCLVACSSGHAPRSWSSHHPDLPGGGEVRVFLPPPGGSQRPLPTIYFLHDLFGSDSILWRQGVMSELEARMRRGEIPRVVVVAPEGRHDYWSDFHGRRRPWESWLTGQLVGDVESRYEVSREVSRRAIAGISMGGYGAVKAALRRPDLFSAASSLSGVLVEQRWEDLESAPWIARFTLKRVFGKRIDDNSFARNDVYRLLDQVPAARRPALRVRCGSEDEYRLFGPARTFAEAARSKGFDVELLIEPGHHDWRYWRGAILEELSILARRVGGADGTDS